MLNHELKYAEISLYFNEQWEFFLKSKIKFFLKFPPINSALFRIGL